MNYQTLITAEALHQLLEDQEREGETHNLAIVDCHFSLAEPNLGHMRYQEGHIPTAVYAHLDEDLAGPVDPAVTGRHPLPSIGTLAKTLGAWGIDNRTQVIVYDDTGGAIAARLWWLLRWLGHQKVALLDGGLSAWREAGHKVTRSTPAISEQHYLATPRSAHSTLLATAADIEAGALSHLVDCRSTDRYSGESEPFDKVAGHIPGAINRPFTDNLDNGRFRSTTALRAEFEELLGLEGLDTSSASKVCEKAIFYCGSGVTAAHNLLAMAHVGLAPARLYNGSWSEWIASGTRPIA